MALTLILFQGPRDLWLILNSGKSLPLHSTSKRLFLSLTHHFHWDYLPWLFNEFGLHKNREMLTLVSVFLGGSMVKNLPANAGDAGSIPGLGRSPGEGNGNPLPYSCLENSMDRGAWWATVHELTKSQIWQTEQLMLMYINYVSYILNIITHTHIHIYIYPHNGQII